METTLWSHSEIVLHWLRSKKLPDPFVSKRIEEITKLTNKHQWRKVWQALHSPHIIYIYIMKFSCQKRGSRSCPLPHSFNGTSLAVSHWKLRMDTYGWVSIQPSQPKQAILRTGFDFNVFFSGVLQFQLVQSLTRHWTYTLTRYLLSFI